MIGIDAGKAHQIGTAPLAENKRSDLITALDLFCIDVKEQKCYQEEGSDGSSDCCRRGELQVRLGLGHGGSEVCVRCTYFWDMLLSLVSSCFVAAVFTRITVMLK